MGVEREIGDVLTVTFYPRGPEGPSYSVLAKIVGYDPDTENVEFEAVGRMSTDIEVA